MKILNGIAFTAQPEAPAFVLAGACGWAVNDQINSPVASCRPLRRQDANAFRLMQFATKLRIRPALRHR